MARKRGTFSRQTQQTYDVQAGIEYIEAERLQKITRLLRRSLHTTITYFSIFSSLHHRDIRLSSYEHACLQRPR